MNIDDIGEPWVEISARPAPGCKALFLDRDGTIIENVDYLADPDLVSLIPGASETLRSFREAGFAIVVVTNQSGVARGLISPAQYRSVRERVTEVLGADIIHATYACPFHREGQGNYAVAHPWRKPAGGMIRAAARELQLDLGNSLLVGDSLSDMAAAADGGVNLAVHVSTGHGRRERAAVEAWESGPGRHSGSPKLRCVESIASISPDDIR
jgi:D-glycero-D-manno-heptose 1,7-bisphosphate phosphatase